ncbi:MAG TPA: TonB family protein [Luteimonas sp.]|nr:TonB family protein [Luteimonas sp.]
MSADGLVQWLFDGALATSAALLLVLALRLPLRRAFGARIAYAAWALVPLALVAVTLPAPRSATALLQAFPGLPMLRPAVVVGTPVPLDGAVAAASAPLFDLALLLAFAWCLGAVLLALRFAAQQRHYLAALGDLRPRGDGTFAANIGQSPAVIGAWRPRIVLPADFEARYPADQASLVVAHEHAHVRRGDVRANLLVAALRCLHWFNPLLHAAAARFRIDQELACDATVLARHPHARRAYADAMLNTQLAVPGLPVGCHWQSSRSLKERILMLKKPQPGAWRRRTGVLALSVVLAGSSYAAWALRPASETAPVYRGSVEARGVAMARILVPKGLVLEVLGPSMMVQRESGAINAILDSRLDLRLVSRDRANPWTVRVKAQGDASGPAVTWSIERDGRVEYERSLQVPADAPASVDLSGLADAQGRSPTLAFSRMPADGVVDLQTYGNPDRASLIQDEGGAYRYAEPLRAFSDKFRANGKAVLLVGVGPDGRVRTVDVESMTPRGAVAGEQLDQFVRDSVFEPRRVDGRPVPTLVRVPVEFSRKLPSPEIPMAAPPVPAGPGAMADAREHTPPPKYPAGAAKDKVSGKVVLVIDVGVDGRATQVQVESSQPAGVFDQAAIGAARDWTFKPIMKDGKPVEGRVRVPITFDASGSPDGESGIAGDSAHDWIRLEKRDPAVATAVCDMATGDRHGGNLHCGRLRPAHAAR